MYGMYVCMYVCMHVCMRVCVTACMCVCMYVCEYTHIDIHIHIHVHIHIHLQHTHTHFHTHRSLDCCISWLKMTGQWEAVKSFILEKAEELRDTKLSDRAFLQYFFKYYPHPIPLDPRSELYAHQTSSKRILAKMIQPRFLLAMSTVKLDTRRSFPNLKDWYLDSRLDSFKGMIVGSAWGIEGLPKFRYESGGSVGGRGTVSMVTVTWE